jgi:uncharacterized protein YbjT (DUF2867 family)
MRLLLLGATGLVGSSTLKLALANPVISEVAAITRRPLPPQNKLVNPVCERIEELAQLARIWVVDAVVCARGTTKAKAGSKRAMRHVDYDLPLLFAKECHAVGVETYALVSAIGASTNSMFFYARTKGELERDISKLVFVLSRSAGQVLSLGREAR